MTDEEFKIFESRAWGIFIKKNGTIFFHEAAYGDVIIQTQRGVENETKETYAVIKQLKVRLYEETES